MENVLEIKNLRKDFKTFSLKDISFSLPKGYIMGFIGPNGAGKTTTLKLIMNLLTKDSGSIAAFGGRHYSLARREMLSQLSSPPACYRPGNKRFSPCTLVC